MVVRGTIAPPNLNVLPRYSHVRIGQNGSVRAVALGGLDNDQRAIRTGRLCGVAARGSLDNFDMRQCLKVRGIYAII